MKKCSWCGRVHPDDAVECSLDQRPRIACDPETEKSIEPESENAFFRNVVIPGGIWLGVFIVSFAMLGIVVFFFSLLTAVVAAWDCAKYQAKGSRVLGISFKPVVVFAVCAIFFFGFGFIWYLMMRHKVLTTALEPETADTGEIGNLPPNPPSLPGGKFPWEF